MDIIAGVSGAIGLARQLLELKGVAKDAQARLLIADLQVQLAGLKGDLAALLLDNQRLAADLAKATAAAPEVVFKGGVYYRPTGDGPFCTTCFDRDGRLVRLTELPRMFHGEGRYTCNACRGRFQPDHLTPDE